MKRLDDGLMSSGENRSISVPSHDPDVSLSDAGRKCWQHCSFVIAGRWTVLKMRTTVMRKVVATMAEMDIAERRLQDVLGGVRGVSVSSSRDA